MTTWACARLVNQCSFRHSSRKRPLNDSMYAFCVGLPGSISRSVTPRVVRPRQHGAPAELQAVVRPQHLRQAARDRERVEDARHRQAAERPRRHHRHGFGRGVVDDRQALQHAAFGRAIEDEVRRPHLVRRLRPGQRLTIGQRHLLAAPAPDLQTRLGVEPIDPLVIDRAGLPGAASDRSCRRRTDDGDAPTRRCDRAGRDRDPAAARTAARRRSCARRSTRAAR